MAILSLKFLNTDIVQNSHCICHEHLKIDEKTWGHLASFEEMAMSTFEAFGHTLKAIFKGNNFLNTSIAPFLVRLQRMTLQFDMCLRQRMQFTELCLLFREFMTAINNRNSKRLVFESQLRYKSLCSFGRYVFSNNFPSRNK